MIFLWFGNKLSPHKSRNVSILCLGYVGMHGGEKISVRATTTEDRSGEEAPVGPHVQLYKPDSQVERNLWLSQCKAFKYPQGDSGLSALTLSLPTVRAESVVLHSPQFSHILVF